MNTKFNIGIDKLYHFVAGGLVAGAVFAISKNVGYSIAASTVAGIGKEVYDNNNHGDVDLWDAIATILGGIVAMVIAVLLDRITV